MNEIFSRDDLDLNEIYAASFQGRDKERFVLLWTAVSEILSAPLGKIRPQDKVAEFCPNSKWSSVNVRIDDLTDFVIRESKGRKVPEDLMTVGAVVNFLLDSA